MEVMNAVSPFSYKAPEGYQWVPSGWKLKGKFKNNSN